MFTSKPYKIVFGALIVLSAGLAVWYDFLGNKHLYGLFKPLTTIFILLFSLLFRQKNTKFFKFVLSALVFCLIGDTLLLFESYFIWGLVAFLIAHVLFTFSFFSIGKYKFSITPLVALLVFGIWYYWTLYDSLNDLKIPVLVYFTVIILMSWQGINLRVWKKNTLTTVLFCAVLLFLISDSILAWSKFKASFQYSGVLILTTYWTSIFLLALSTTLRGVNGINSDEG